MVVTEDSLAEVAEGHISVLASPMADCHSLGSLGAVEWSTVSVDADVSAPGVYHFGKETGGDGEVLACKSAPTGCV